MVVETSLKEVADNILVEFGNGDIGVKLNGEDNILIEDDLDHLALINRVDRENEIIAYKSYHLKVKPIEKIVFDVKLEGNISSVEELEPGEYAYYYKQDLLIVKTGDNEIHLVDRCKSRAVVFGNSWAVIPGLFDDHPESDGDLYRATVEIKDKVYGNTIETKFEINITDYLEKVTLNDVEARTNIKIKTWADEKDIEILGTVIEAAFIDKSVPIEVFHDFNSSNVFECGDIIYAEGSKTEFEILD